MGRKVEGVILVSAVVYCILATYLYITRNDTEGRKFLSMAEDIKLGLQSVDDSQKKILTETKTFADITASTFADLSDRLAHLEKDRQSLAPASVKITEPIQVSVVYQENKKEKPTKKPLLKRAGLLPKENN